MVQHIFKLDPPVVQHLFHGGLSQWGRSNRPRIRLGTVKGLSASWELSQLVSPPTGLCQENGPLSYVSLVSANYCTIGSGQYTLLSGRPVQAGQVLFEFKFITGIEWFTNIDRTDNPYNKQICSTLSV